MNQGRTAQHSTSHHRTQQVGQSGALQLRLQRSRITPAGRPYGSRRLIMGLDWQDVHTGTGRSRNSIGVLNPSRHRQWQRDGPSCVDARIPQAMQGHAELSSADGLQYLCTRMQGHWRMDCHQQTDLVNSGGGLSPRGEHSHDNARPQAL